VVAKSRTKHSTLIDVAREAGVSVSTAARVLRGSPYPVAEVLQERVRKAAEKVGYVPNLLAKRLRGGAHPSIGLIVGNMIDPYFGAIAQAVSVAANDRSLLAVVANMQRDPKLEIAMIRELWEHRVNGLVLAGGGFDQMTHKDELADLVAQVKRSGIVVVSLAERGFPLPVFSVDNFQIGVMLARHALGYGHSQIGILAGLAHSFVTQQRLAGSLSVLREAGIEPGIVHSEFGIEGGIAGATRLLEQNPKLTVILANADTLALGTIRALSRLSLRVPDDVSILSAGATSYAAISTPALTTIDIRLEDCCRSAVEYLAAALDGRKPSVRAMPLPSLISGLSVRPLQGQ
jgi:LacI family transcriptional regulator